LTSKPGIPILMERIIPTSMTGTVNETYAQGLQTYVNYITGKGAYAIVDPHNFARYYGNVISDYNGFQAFVSVTILSFLQTKIIDESLICQSGKPSLVSTHRTAK
jgi:hypothetical protein